MFGIKIRNEFLDIGQEKINIKLQSPLFFGDAADAEVIKNSFVMTTKLDDTPRNNRLLNIPQSINNPNKFSETPRLTAEVWAEGSILGMGNLEIVESTDTKISIRVSFDNASILKRTMLSDIPFQGVGDINNIPNICKDSLYNPQNYDFIATMVWNPQQWDGKYSFPQPFHKAHFQNLWDLTQDIVWDNSATLVPFPKISKILKGVFSHISLNLENKLFQDFQDYENMFLYYANPLNYRDNGVYLPNQLKYNNINIKNHLPKIYANEFLKILRTFNAAPFSNLLETSVQILRAEPILISSAKKNWTKKVIKGYTKREKNNKISTFNIATPTSLSGVSSDIKQVKGTENATTAPSEIHELNGTYLQSGINQIHYRKEENITSERIRVMPSELSLSDGENKFESKFSFLPQSRIFLEALGAMYQEKYYVPCAKQKNEDKENLSLCIYRGIQENGNHPQTFYQNPISCNESELPNGNPISVNSTLTLEGDKGIIAQHWAKWFRFLKSYNEIDFLLNLSAADIRMFNFFEKVHIGSGDYLVKSLDIAIKYNTIEQIKGTFAQINSLIF